jgi:probable rRNA maturation factor
MLKLDLGIINFTKGKIKKDIVEKAILNTLKVLGVSKNVELSLVICGERRIRSLNKKFRAKDGPTDVLSFGFENGTSNDFINLGEIIICFSYMKKQAKKAGVGIEKELALLASHGTIHLFGIDHERSIDEDKRTEQIQTRVLTKIFNE